MRKQVFHGRYDSCYAGLIVGTQQCSSVGNDQLLPHVVRQFRKRIGREHDLLRLVQHDRSAVVRHDPRLHVLTRHIGAGIHVCNKSDGGDAFT